ncbi:MAG: PQQ-dependent sugar dehydrogenase, partial [Holophagales bacterium]|nr:PQQ-dependent sugar dehydrogenase [Holophagales bacterium]
MQRNLALLACLAYLAFPSPTEGQVPSFDVTLVTNSLDGSTVGLANAGDGSGRLFAVGQDGAIQIWDGAQVLATPFLDVSSLITPGGEQGLLGLAFHPDYATNGFFYVYYIDESPNPGDTVVARYTVSGNPNVA